ncbi:MULTISPECIES: hypothetical protein [Dethiosulfovibrio]|uniref:LPS export ABC transporter periplasmic protein LptC n=2 Tax=Dethiosulfovibrio TaxID=47054 RepID=A0ABS9EKE5_9BACT|nr:MULTISPECIES: hypothetical protein [Dethiosulfovibrio]MCF4113908.1 hypothetical protein [Dethiosulfovibrio russensis]MCF4141679.1 hypothetical protein [Dethiosulfovibrio marinus]MCF4143904.1 hypothetical protein [Dethiosulfovibrio acidaminovorans]MEA3284084.1 hypothetical protein [Synergistota bacterium]
MSGRFLWLSVVIAVVVGFSFMLYSDLNLDYLEVENSAGEAGGVELKDVTLRRSMSGDLWTFLVRSVSKEGRIGNLKDVTGSRVGPDGSVWSLASPEGDYDSSGDRLVLRDGTGVFEEKKENFDWIAPVILWGGASSDRWSFPDGLTISGDRYSLTGKSAEASPSEGVVVQEGVMVWWHEGGSGR